MFIRVQLLNGVPQQLWYFVPDAYRHKVSRNSIVHVPIRNRVIPACVMALYQEKPSTISFAIKDICAVETLPHDESYYAFLTSLSYYYQQEPHMFIRRLYQFLHQKKETPLNENYSSDIYKSTISLTDEQKKICSFTYRYINENRYCPIVVHGVTGSGKTEVYKDVMLHALNQQKTTILLLPEVTLARAFEDRLKQEMPDAPLYGFHSGKSPKEKTALWNAINQERPLIIIGVHLPVLLPISNLGLIIVDEEHDAGYQEKKHPKINTKYAALIKAEQKNIPIIFGSATPSLATLYNVKTKKWPFFQLKKRFSGTLPSLSILSLTENKNRKEFWITKELQTAIENQLKKKEQTIIFINRRGVSFFVQCRQCTFIFMCTNCSVSLTLHNNNILQCHYCSLQQELPTACSQCKAHESELIKKGVGTQKVVSILQKMFPLANIARADKDITAKKNLWQKTVTDMMNGAIDILVGTQTITKGFHFPRVTLVGVLWADLQLNFPVYNATETALQQLIQVAGRAGRENNKSHVIIQYMHEHTLFNYVNEIDYLQFYAHEMESRKELQYPPYTWFAEIELKHSNEQTINLESHTIADALISYEKKHHLSVNILGPAQPPIAKIQSMFSKKIYLKSTSYQSIITLFQSIDRTKYHSFIYFTPHT